jgi:hypothetical protein
MIATRRLAAILTPNVAGYSRLIGADEEGTHERLQAHLAELVNPKIEEHRGGQKHPARHDLCSLTRTASEHSRAAMFCADDLVRDATLAPFIWLDGLEIFLLRVKLVNLDDVTETRIVEEPPQI